MNRVIPARLALLWLGAVTACTGGAPVPEARPGPATDDAVWLAGDHHVHSRFSVGWNTSTNPPTPILGGDAIYPIPLNARMGRDHGLRWMVATDHGGPGHSKVNLEQAWPELVQARAAVPEVMQFFGMEFDTPGADHSSLIVPHSHDEAGHVHAIESRFSKLEPWPQDSTWDRPSRMLEALAAMRGLPLPPVVIAHHPARSASAIGNYGLDTPAEFRDWNDAAPGIAVGMEGAPGHQAIAINPDGSIDSTGARGGYFGAPTMGGFDQMTARLGGLWDAMLGEGRRWWITANSDSHRHWREGGVDFWPGEYSKTWVWAAPEYEAVLESLRAGRIFVATGDLISALHVTVRVVGGLAEASIGGTLEVPNGSTVEVEIRWLDPDTTNHHGDNPTVARVDLITGLVRGPVTDRSMDTNATTRVAARFSERQWRRDGLWRSVSWRLEKVISDGYLRVRGTGGDELEPRLDPRGEDPWTDLWFYSNPVFLRVR